MIYNIFILKLLESIFVKVYKKEKIRRKGLAQTKFQDNVHV